MNASSSVAAAKPQRAKASSRWDVMTASTNQYKAKASPRYDSKADQLPDSAREPCSPSAQNFVVKSPSVLGSSIVELLAQVRADRSSLKAPWSSSHNTTHNDAGPPERFDVIRRQNRPDEWSRNCDDTDAGAGQRHDDFSRIQKGSVGWNGNSGDGNVGARQRQDKFDRKRNRSDDWSGNFGDWNNGAQPRHDTDRKKYRSDNWEGNFGSRDARPPQGNYDYNRIQRKGDDWVKNSDVMKSRNMSCRGKVNRGHPQTINRGHSQTMRGQNMHPVPYGSGQNIHQHHSMLAPSKSYGQAGETNDSWTARGYSSANNMPAQPGIPVRNFPTPTGIRPDHNQFETCRHDRENASMGQDQRHFPLPDPEQMYSPGIGRPTNKFQGNRRSQADCSLLGSRPDQRADRISHDTRYASQAAASSGTPKFSNMDEKLEAVLAPAFAVESVGPAVEAIVTAARQLGANSSEALALFADKDHATILSVYFNALEEKATNLAGTDQFLIYQRAVAFGRAILNMAK